MKIVICDDRENDRAALRTLLEAAKQIKVECSKVYIVLVTACLKSR